MSCRCPTPSLIKAALALVACTITTAARAEYAVVDLGALVNASTSGTTSVAGVNLTRQVALTSSPDGLTPRALLYSAGAIVNLGTLGGADSAAAGINDAGQVVGRSKTSAGVNHAFVWTPGGTGGVATNPQMKDINPTGSVSGASAINASGQIVGFVTIPKIGQPNQDRAFLYTNGTLTQLPVPTGGGFSDTYAYGLNDAGKVVGEAYTALSPLAHGFIYNGTTSTEIGNLGGGSSTPLAINKNDRVVGYSTSVDGYDRAFVYTSGTMTDLGALGTGHYSYANAINNKDQIAGGAFTDDFDTIEHAFVSDGVNPMVDLNTKLTSKAANWVLTEATGINDNGVVVGTGRLSSEKHGFMLVPLANGDANADGAVDFLDLATLAQNYNTSGSLTWEQGDFNGDGSVDFLDLAEMAQNYNTTQGSFAQAAAAAFAGSSPVPEPTLSLFYAAAGVIFLFRRRRGFSSVSEAR
jgi:probable HAF family extracellular repeat protein